MNLHPKPNSTNTGLIKIISAPIIDTLPTQSGNVPNINTGNNNTVGQCTADAFICPSGVAVGRSGPNCQFVCPNVNR